MKGLVYDIYAYYCLYTWTPVYTCILVYVYVHGSIVDASHRLAHVKMYIIYVYIIANVYFCMYKSV